MVTESLRILILEDNPADAELVKFELQEAGLDFTSKVVMTEGDFVRELQEFSPDLILSDYDLPKYNGALALAEAKRRRPDTPFILVTGAVTEDRAIDILTQGAKDYVLKTRLQQRLVPAVRRALAEAEEHRARRQAELDLREAHRTLEERVKIRTAELEAEITARKKTEESLRDSEERQRLVLQASSIGTFEVDLLTGEGHWNATEFELLGLKPGDVKATPDTFFRFVHPDDIERLRNEWEEATRSGKLDADFRIVRADGQECWLAGKGAFILDGHSDGHDTGTSGNPRRFIGVNFDITGSKQAEVGRREALEKAEEGERILKTLMEYVPEGITIADAPDVKIRMVSRYGREMLGEEHDRMTADEVADQWKVYEKDGRTPMAAADLPLSRATLNGETILNEELVQVNTQGRALPLLCNAAPIRDDSGRITGAIVAWRDISKLKQVEEELEKHHRNLEGVVQERTEALRRSQELLNETQRISKVGGWEFDVSTSRVSWTDEVYRMHRVSKDYDPSNPEQDIQFYAPEDRKRIAAAFQRALAQGEPYDLELQLVPARGDRIWVRTMGRAEKEGGKVVRVFGNILDITEMKSAQMALRDLNATLEKRVAEGTEELRQSEQRFRLALKNAPVSVAVQDRDLVYVWAYNQRTRRPDEIAGKTDADLFAPEDVIWILEEKRRVLESGTEMNVQHWLTSNGRRLFLDLHYEPLRDSAGEITGIGIVAVDLTEQKRAEDSLASDHALLDTLLVQAPIGFAYLDRELRYVFINQKLAELNGISAAAHIGKRVHDIVPTLAAAVEKACNLILATGQPIKDQEFSGETALAPGVKRYLNVSWYPVSDGAGEIVGFGAIIEEITERKQAEEALRESDERLRFAMESIHIGAWDLNLVDHSAFRSLEHDRIFGYEDLLPSWTYEMFLEHVLPEDRMMVDSKFQHAMATQSDWEFECRIRHTDGEVRWIFAAGRHKSDASGNLKRLAGIVQDITKRKIVEEALRASDEQFRVLIQNLQSAIALIDENGMFRIVNNSFLRVFEIPQDATILNVNNRDWAQWQVFDEQGVLLEVDEHPVRKAALTRTAVKNELVAVKSPSGPDLKWLLVSAEPILNKAGGIHQIICTYYDITQRKAAEEKLRQSREDLERAQLVGQVGSWRLDTRRNILTWSDENHRIFGLPKGTPLSYETFLSTIHPDDRQYVDTQWQAGMRGAPYDIEHRIVVADQVKWVREKAYLEFDATGLLLGGFGITQDITVRKQAEQELRESEEKFRNLFMNMTEEVHFWKLVRDEQGQIKTWQVVDINPPTVKAWGRESREDTIGRTADEIYPGATEHFMPIVQKIMAEGIPYSYENYFPPPVDRYFRFTSIPLGEYFFTTGADITRSRKAEEALKQQAKELEDANKELESFSYSVSHDLKAPLRAIDGYFRMFLKKYGSTLDDDGAHLIDVIRGNTEKMGVLIDDLLAFSKVLKGSMTLSEIDMDKLAGEVWDDIRAANQERDLEFRITKLLPGFGDSALIRQVLSNLISNAVKFTKSRKPGIIEMSSYAEPGKVVYRVKDNGIGFDMAFYNKLFGVFQRLHGDEEYEGTGVGLAIVQRIIHRHGGRVWAESEPDKGTTFYFTLPTRKNDSPV